MKDIQRLIKCLRMYKNLITVANNERTLQVLKKIYIDIFNSFKKHIYVDETFIYN